MMVNIICEIIGAIAMIAVALISKNTNKKIEKIDALKAEFEKQLDEVKKENDKTYLTDFLSDIENGQTKTDIQIKRAYEIYEEYSSLNGNSYVHNKWEDLVKEGIL